MTDAERKARQKAYKDKWRARHPDWREKQRAYKDAFLKRNPTYKQDWYEEHSNVILAKRKAARKAARKKKHIRT